MVAKNNVPRFRVTMTTLIWVHACYDDDDDARLVMIDRLPIKGLA